MDSNIILALDCKKHIKIYKLKQLGLTNRQVADMCETNPGHVRNVMIDYGNKPEKVDAANKISVNDAFQTHPMKQQ